MRILVNIGHPAHVHFFKNFIWKMLDRGHQVFISSVDKDVTLNLLNSYRFEYHLSGKRGCNLFENAKEILLRDMHVYYLQRKNQIDIITGIADIFGAHISKITRAKSIVFTDTEHARLSNIATFPFADVICTPSCFNRDLGKKQLRYNGYHEMAYLHPNYFRPNKVTLDNLGLSTNDNYTVLRLISWGASHDIGHSGIKNIQKFVKTLERYGPLFITSEKPLPGKLEKLRIKLPPTELHNILNYASLYIGEGSTIASECAILGTHAIYINTLELGYIREQEQTYKLVYHYADPKNMEEKALDKAVELLNNNNLKTQGKQKKERILKDKIDVTNFMVEFFEKYFEG